MKWAKKHIDTVLDTPLQKISTGLDFHPSSYTKEAKFYNKGSPFFDLVALAVLGSAIGRK
jgi:hypothetical protein